MTDLTLAHGLSFSDLYRAEGLARIDDLFRAHLAGVDQDLTRRLVEARARPDSLDAKAQSDLLLAGAAVHAELGEVLAGTASIPPGRRMVFESVGIAVEDVAAAQLAYEGLRARS